MYKYWGFGLHIASEIEFPELLPYDFTDEDVTISLGKTPEKIEGEGLIKKPFSSITKDEYLLNVKNICKYYVGFGKQIIVEPAAGIDAETVRLALLGVVIVAIIYQRGFISLHCSAIVKDGKLILFAGNSGAGKSTLLAHLSTKGYEIFTDDICVLKQDTSGNDGIVGVASFPMLKLWEDAIARLDHSQFTKDFKLRPKLPKYGQFFHDSFNLSRLPVDKIFILMPKNHAEDIIVNRLTAIQGFKILEKLAYKFQLISNKQLRAAQFSLMAQLTGQFPVYEVNRPNDVPTIELLSDTLEKLF